MRQPSRPVRFVIVFALCVVVQSLLWMAPLLKPVVAGHSKGLVAASGALIQLVGGRVIVRDAVLSTPTGSFAVEMKDGCNGITVMILLWSAVLAFPATWARKAHGVLWGTLAIQSVNFVRFISLFYLGQYNYAWFEFAHWYLWESLIMLDAMVFFWLWIPKGVIKPAVANAEA